MIVPYDQFPKTCLNDINKQMHSQNQFISKKKIRSNLAIDLKRWVAEQRPDTKEEEQAMEDSQ